MDSVHEKDAPLPVAEQQNFRHRALTKLTAFVVGVSLGSVGVAVANELYDGISRRDRSAATFNIPMADHLHEMDRPYPTLESGYYAPRIYDEKASNESTVVYRHEGLDSISFARPSLETSRKILDAGNLADLEASAAPFFKSIGINLHITTNNHEAKKNIDQLAPDDLEQTRQTVLATLNEIAITPRELVRYANVNSLVIAKNLRSKNNGVAGVAYMNGIKPGTIALDISGSGRMGHANTFNHELGHHLGHQLDIDTKNAFSKAYEKLNLPGFVYKDKLPKNNPDKMAEHQQLRNKSLVEMAIISDYSATSTLEDQAESYTSLWRGDMAPDDRDESHNTLLGSKRILWVKVLDQAAPGFADYLGGLSTTAIYGHEKVPVDQESLRVMSMYHDR